jgi:folate-dependent phosphoribosylglycinamide formyltransferase PurN
MRVAIFASEEYMFTFGMMKELIPKLREEGHTVVGMVLLPDKLTKYEGIQIPLMYLKVFGFGVFCKLVFRCISRRMVPGSFEKLCIQYGTEKLEASGPNDAALVKWAKDKEIDVILNFVGHLMKKDIIEAPKVCILNKHAGLLPAYKGVFPVFWALKQGDKVGVSIHKIDETVDGGETISQREYPFEKDGKKSVYDYYGIIFKDTPELVAESLRFIVTGERKLCGHGMKPSYFGLPIRKDYLEFKKGGYRFI